MYDMTLGRDSEAKNHQELIANLRKQSLQVFSGGN